MPISFYIKSSAALLNCTLWTPDKSRGEGIVFCHGWGGGTPYDGGSVVYGPWGERLAYAGASDAVTDDISCITLDGAEVTRVRERFPFVQDRRALALV